MLQKRTDLAVEAKELYEESTTEQTKIAGIEASDRVESGITVTTVKVLNEQGEKAIGKPKGTYVTLSLEQRARMDGDELRKAAEVLGCEIVKLAELSKNAAVLVAGLGNLAVTPDAIGPQSVKGTVITRHLKEQLPEYFGGYRPVSALETGVLGTTGIESAEMIKAVTEKIRPSCLIAIDALATRRLSRVCATVQLSNSGIVPGSGVGNSRAAINRETVGVPVIAIGVPTVVDVGTLCADIMEEAGFGEQEPEELSRFGGGMIVTPRDIDSKVKSMSRLVGMGINFALHSEMSIEDMDWMLGNN